MTRESLENLLDRVAAWPEEDQEKLARFVSEIEAGHFADEDLSDEDLAALERGLADADAGRFAPDGAVQALFDRYFK